MFLLTVKKKFIKELTVIGVILTTVVTLVYHIFIPERYFLWFPAIPIFFYLFGLFYIYMFAFNYSLGLDKLAMTYLVCKALKLILSVMILLFYGFVIGHEVVTFFATFILFYFAFLIFETRFFLRFEAKLKLRKQANNEKTTVHSNASAPVSDGSGRDAESSER